MVYRLCGLKTFLGREDRQITAQKSDAATDALRRLRLIAPRADGSLKLLNPLRECVVIERPLKNPNLERVLNAGLKLLEKGKYIGTDKWPVAKAEPLPHIGNFAPILVEAGRTQPVARVLQVIEPARMLAMDEGRFEQTAFLELAKVLRPRATDNSKKAAAAALHAAGDLALRRGDLDGAKTQLEAARDIFVRIGEGLGEANALRSLGELALRRDDLDGAKSQLEAARNIHVRIGDSLGEANALQSLGELALRAMISMERRAIWRRRGKSMSGLARALARRMRFAPLASWRFGAMISMARRANWRRREISMYGSATALARRIPPISKHWLRPGKTFPKPRRCLATR
jgi:hypothetical protein